MRWYSVLIVYALSIVVQTTVSAGSPELIGVIEGDTIDTQFGWRILPLVDQNNDGFDDILIHEQFRNHLFYGGNPFDTIPALTFDSTNGRTSNLGDINGDSFSDFACLGRSPYGWKLNLYYGGPSVDTIRDLWFGLDTIIASGFTVLGNNINVNESNEIIAWDGTTQEAISLFELGGDSDSIPELRIFPANISLTHYSFGFGLTAGDFSGDGIKDIAVGFNHNIGQNEPGAIYLYWGGAAFDTIPDMIIRGPEPYVEFQEKFGRVLEYLGDISGDGYDDFYASAGISLDDTLGYIYFGGPSIDTLPDVILTTRDSKARLAGDVNNDGYNDLIVSNPVPLFSVGHVAIYLGGPELDSIPDWYLHISDLEGARDLFGLDCSGIGDFNGDGIDDFAFSSGRGIGRFEVYIYSGWDETVDVPYSRESTLPDRFNLSYNYPNPFNLSTTIEFDIPQKSHVALSIHNVLGQEVRTLLKQELSVGSYTLQWDGKDAKGNEVASGLYLYRLNANSFSDMKKMILLK